MLRKNNFYLIILFQLLFVFFISIIIPSIFLKEKPGISQTSFNNTLSLSQNYFHFESFVSDRDNLNSISVLLKNPALKSNKQVKIELLNKNKETIQLLETSGISIGDPSWINFKFAPISSKKGDVFYIKITSDALKDNSLYIYGDKDSQKINFKTTYKSSTFINSFRDNLNYQKEKLFELNKLQSIFYLGVLFVINVLFFSSL